MDIENLRLAILNLQKSLAALRLKKQEILVISAEVEQAFAKEIESANTAEDGGLESGRRVALLSEKISKKQTRISSVDEQIHLESKKLSVLQKKLDSILRAEHLERLEEERGLLTRHETIPAFEFYRQDGNQHSIDYYSPFDSKDAYKELPVAGSFHIITGVNGLGKSRYLQFLARHSGVQKYYKRIICLSGTMYDRFPRANDAVDYACEYYYFGNRVNSNILSEKAPFRILSTFMLEGGCNGLVGAMAGSILEGMGFSRQIRLVFSPRQAGKSTSGFSRSEKTGVTLELSNTLQQTNSTEECLAKVRERSIQLSDMVFEKGLRKLGLADLSSGERLYLLSTLALCFCVTERTLVLFDEPENSLHPQWQAKIIKDMVSIIKGMADECTVVVATHSPLIVSSAPNDISYIRDLPSSEPWYKSELYGRNADTILSEQFGLTSPRSLTVAALIQDCLTALTNVHHDPEIFLAAADNLLSHNIQLDENDPLHDTIKRIMVLRGVYV